MHSGIRENLKNSTSNTIIFTFLKSTAFFDGILYIAASFNILYFFLRAKFIHEHIRNGTSTDSYTSCFSYLVALINCILWLKFGIESRNIITVIVNGSGLALSLFSIIGYYYMAEYKISIRKQVTLSMILTYGYLFTLKIGLISWQTLGPLSSFVTVIMLSLPLSSYVYTLYKIAILKRTLFSFHNLRQVAMKRKMTASLLSPLTSISALISSLAWGVYGWSIQDDFLCYTNALSTIISFIQVIISPRNSNHSNSYRSSPKI